MTAPRLELDLVAVTGNTRSLVDRLGPRGIRVIGVTKSVLGSPRVAQAMLDGGVSALADSRIENLARLGAAGLAVDGRLIRSPMLSQAGLVVRHAATSFNTEPAVLTELSDSAAGTGGHSVVLMVELGDLREGISPDDLLPLARTVQRLPGLSLIGIGTNLACQSGVAPDDSNMGQLSQLADDVESATGLELSIISGGNSASLGWATQTADVGRVNELRLGESILLGLDPLSRRPVEGLRTDAVRLFAELIEVQMKPEQPWGQQGQSAFGAAPARSGAGFIRQGLLALGRQDVELAGLVPPVGVRLLGMTSDHLVVDLGDVAAAVGDELEFGVDYAGLLRAMTSPYVRVITRSANGCEPLDDRKRQTAR